MGQQKVELESSASGTSSLGVGVRVGLAVVGGLLLLVGAAGLLVLRLDGAGVTSFVVAGAVTVSLGLVGRLPSQLKLKDVEMAWQLQVEEKKAVELVAEKPQAGEPSLLAKASEVEVGTDLTIPLFEDSARLDELARVSPKAALLAVYGELEDQIRGLARDVGLVDGARPAPVPQITLKLVRASWLTGWHASVVTSLSNARNAVAHRFSDVPDIEVAALLELAADIAADVKVRRRAALAGYEPEPLVTQD